MSKLKDEILNDPLGIGYSSMTDLQVTDSLNATNRDEDIQGLSGDEVFECTDPQEMGALLPAEKQNWLIFCNRQTINPNSPANAAFVRSIFGKNSATVSALAAKRKRLVSRGRELGLGWVRVGEVEAIRKENQGV